MAADVSLDSMLFPPWSNEQLIDFIIIILTRQSCKERGGRKGVGGAAAHRKNSRAGKGRTSRSELGINPDPTNKFILEGICLYEPEMSVHQDFCQRKEIFISSASEGEKVFSPLFWLSQREFSEPKAAFGSSFLCPFLKFISLICSPENAGCWSPLHRCLEDQLWGDWRMPLADSDSARHLFITASKGTGIPRVSCGGGRTGRGRGAGGSSDSFPFPWCCQVLLGL